MQESPPRRSRRTPPKGGGPSLPFVPIIIGVVILGFVIGAGLSVVGNHGAQNGSVAFATSTPQLQPTFGTVTEAPAETSPSAIPEPSRTPRVTPIGTRPAATPSPARSARLAAASPRPAPQNSPARPAPSVAGTVAAATAPAAATPAPATPAARVTAEPTVVATLAPTDAPPATLAPTPSVVAVDADGQFSRLAGSVVRQYLLALAAGDTQSAYAALAQPPGPAGVPERGAVDSSLRIEKIQARGTDSAASVSVDVTTASGPYYGQYTVHRSATGAAVIVSHTFAKP